MDRFDTDEEAKGAKNERKIAGVRLGSVRRIIRHHLKSLGEISDKQRKEWLGALFQATKAVCFPKNVLPNVQKWCAAYWPEGAELNTRAAWYLTCLRDERWNASDYGVALDLTDEIRTALKAWTILPFDVSREELRERSRTRRRERDRVKKASERSEKGRITRSEYVSTSASTLKPWLAAGFKTRRTWERHGKPIAPVASPSPHIKNHRSADTLATSGAVEAKQPEKRAKPAENIPKTVETAPYSLNGKKKTHPRSMISGRGSNGEAAALSVSVDRRLRSSPAAPTSQGEVDLTLQRRQGFFPIEDAPAAPNQRSHA